MRMMPLGDRSSTSVTKSAVKVVLQVAPQARSEHVPDAEIPTRSDFQRWVDVAASDMEWSEVCVRIVGTEEAARLNRRYRGCCVATNVLSFPCDTSLLPTDEAEANQLGDIVIAAPVVLSEAREQGRQLMGHWAHLFVHGMLHLRGYDHIKDRDAARMEAREVSILSELGFVNTPHCGQS